jgi:hypothetical protein
MRLSIAGPSSQDSFLSPGWISILVDSFLTIQKVKSIITIVFSLLNDRKFDFFKIIVGDQDIGFAFLPHFVFVMVFEVLLVKNNPVVLEDIEQHLLPALARSEFSEEVTVNSVFVLWSISISPHVPCKSRTAE